MSHKQMRFQVTSKLIIEHGVGKLNSLAKWLSPTLCVTLKNVCCNPCRHWSPLIDYNNNGNVFGVGKYCYVVSARRRATERIKKVPTD